MQIDPFSVVLAGVLIRTILAVLFLVFWLTDRRTPWFGWWSVTFLLGNVSALFFLTGGFTTTYFSYGFGTAFLIAAFSCAWQGARAFEGRAPLWLPLVGVPVLWLTVCVIPAFLDNTLYRLFLSSILLSWVIGATALEFWRGREEAVPSRWPIIVLFGALAAVFAARIPFAGVLPFPFGAMPTQTNWLAAFSMVLILHTVALAVLIVAISRERLEREQQLKAQTDLLTGALNRRAFLAWGERLMERHRMAARPLCLLMLDIDHFKPLNDRLGHAGGDQILTRFVQIMHDNIRPGDLLFRMGGDEFCCLLPETRADQAHLMAERVRKRIEFDPAGLSAESGKITISMGIASTETCGYVLEDLMHYADMAVYAAKRQGRNRVVVATARDAGEPRAGVIPGASAASGLAE
jgi:diguanylate cyclase (GGDEF)-like protein